MSRRRSWVLLPAVAAILWAPSAVAQAPDQTEAAARAEARQRFENGVGLMTNENWEVALAEFDRSFELFPTRSALFNRAMCLKALHRYVEALDAFERWTREYAAVADPAEIQATDDAVAELQRFLGSLAITVTPDGAHVRVDGRDVGAAPLPGPLVVDVGRHRVEAALEGVAPVSMEVLVVPLEETMVELALEVPARPGSGTGGPGVSGSPGEDPPSADEGVDSAWFWSVAGTAIAMGAGGAVAGGIMLSVDADIDELASRCATGDRSACDEGRPLLGDYEDAQLATNVLLFSAAAVAVSAVVLALFTDFDGEDDRESPEPVLGAYAAPLATPTGSLAGASIGVTLGF